MAEVANFGPRKTIFILAIVVGCFAVLWPKIFYPMLVASVTPSKLSSDDSACCDVIFESDVTTVDIMQEMCQNILRHHQVDPRVKDALNINKLTPHSVSLCREEVLARCGIDLSSFLAERERLGKSYKQVLEEIRAFNSSFCLRLNFGVPLSQLGTPHLIRYHILMPHSPIKQERRTPPHAGGFHPAMRERGRAIPASHIVPKVSGRPEKVLPKMRPTLGGAGHVVQAPKGNGSMGVIMPLYTIGIVVFFVYTIVKVLKKNSDSEITSHYPGEAAEKEFRDMVFRPDLLSTGMTAGSVPYRRKERSQSPLRSAPTIEELQEQPAGDIEIDQLRRRLEETERAMMEKIIDEIAKLSCSGKDNLNSQSTTKEVDSKTEETENSEQSPAVKVMGLDLTASCEGGQKCSRPPTPVTPTPLSQLDREKTPPVPIYLEGALPPQCELLVTDSETQEQKVEEDAEAPVVLSGKMTLSLISLDQNAAEPKHEADKLNGVDSSVSNNVEGIVCQSRISNSENRELNHTEESEEEEEEEDGEEKELELDLEEEQVEEEDEEEENELEIESEEEQAEEEELEEDENELEIDLEEEEEQEEEEELEVDEDEYEEQIEEQ